MHVRAPCLPFAHSRVDATTQVLVEYVTNDGYHHGSVDNSLVRSFERLLRKLLNFGRAPAVVLLEFLATDVKVSKLPFYATGVCLCVRAGDRAVCSWDVGAVQPPLVVTGLQCLPRWAPLHTHCLACMIACVITQ
jgi:hypothetical protein